VDFLHIKSLSSSKWHESVCHHLIDQNLDQEGQPYGTKLNDAMLQNRKSGINRCQEAECIVVYELMQADMNKNIDALLD